MANIAPKPAQTFTHHIFGAHIRTWRNDVHLTQHELAHKIGVTSGFMAHVETGRTLPSAKTCEALAHALGVPVLQVLHAAGHVSKGSEPSDDEYLEPELRVFFREVWPKMSTCQQEMLNEFVGMMRARHEKTHVSKSEKGG